MSDVLLRDIVAARISDFVVNDDNFAVIAVVQLQTEDLEFRFEKKADLAACRQIVLEYMFIDGSAAHAVQKQAYRHAFLRLLCQKFDQRHPDKILFDDEVFHIDGVLRSLNISHHPVKKRHSVRNQLHLIVLAVKSVSVDLIQLDQMPPVPSCRTMKRVARIVHFLHLFF